MRYLFRLILVLGAFSTTVFSPHVTLAATVMLHGVKTEVYFSPRGGAEEAIVRTIGHAKREICVLAYSFTSAPINTALEAAHRRKVKVRMVLDKSQLTARGGKLQNLVEAGIPVIIDRTHAIAHNKVMILDGRKVITGSFNFTKSAEERNAENLLIIHSRPLSRKYMQDFEQHVEHGQHYEP